MQVYNQQHYINLVNGVILTKILINALSAKQGGGQTYVRNLLANIPAGKELVVYILAPDSLVFTEIPDKIIRLAVPRKWTYNPYFRVIWERVSVPKIIRNFNVDILFCPGGSVGRGIPQSCKIVTTFQNMMPFDLKQRQKYPLGPMRVRNWLLEKILLSGMLRSNLVIFISEFAKSVIEHRANNRLINSVVIPHGISTLFRRSSVALAKPSWLPHGPYFLYVSTLDVYKAQLEVIKAYAIFKRNNPSSIKLVLVGPEYLPYGDQVRALIVSLDMSEDVFLLGNVPHNDLPAAYQNACINLFASETENCPFILLEAMGAGRPALVSRCPPMPEFAGDSVMYFDPTDPEDLAGKLTQLLRNEPLMEMLASKALLQSSKYEWDVTGKATWEAFEALMQRQVSSISV